MLLFLFFCLLIAFVKANVEKIIFKGPERITIPLEHPNLDDLRLERITPLHWSLRTQLSAIFPSNEAKRGEQSWFLLDSLKHGQRYEVRVCWLATVCQCSYSSSSRLPSVSLSYVGIYLPWNSKKAIFIVDTLALFEIRRPFHIII